MIRALCNWIVRASALLAPKNMRARWREEWLAEIAAAGPGRTQFASLARVLGAPVDAVWLRWTAPVALGVGNGWTADLRDAWRSLLKTPLQSATMVVCLAVGTSMVVSVAAILNALTWGESPGIVDHNRLVRIGATPPSGRPMYSLKQSDYLAANWDDARGSLESVTARTDLSFKVRLDDALHRVRGSLVRGNYFNVLGTTPAAGRLLNPGDDQASAPFVAVIGYPIWMRRFGGDTAIIGKVLLIDEKPVEIVGVTPHGFGDMDAGNLGETADSREHIWMPIASWPAARRGADFSPILIGRLAPGVSLAEAESRLRAFLPSLKTGPQDRPARLALRPLRLIPMLGRDLVFFFALMLSVPLMVLLIGCANTAGLQAARTSWRIHELAIRTSMGATRGRLARLLSIEIFLTAATATLLAWCLMKVALRYSTSMLPFAVVADWRVLSVTVGLPVLLTLIAGWLPSWRATGFDVLSGLRMGGRGATRGSLRGRRVMVIGQVALSVLLVCGSILITRSISGGPLAALDSADNIVVAGLYVTDQPGNETERRAAASTFIEAASAMAGPGDVAFSTGGLRMPSAVRIGPEDSKGWSEAHIATRAFFDVLGLTLLRGRLYEEREPGVMVVNESFMRRSGRAEILGTVYDITSRGLGSDPSGPKGVTVKRRVVGVVADAYERFSPGDDPRTPLVYLPLDTRNMTSVGVFLRTPDRSVAQARLATLASTLRPPTVLRPLGTVQSVMAEPYEGLRWLSRALSGAGSVALILAAIGLFALIATSVAQRAHEFAVRHALGASREEIGRLVARDVARMVLTGFAIGLLLTMPIWALVRNEILRHAILIDWPGMAAAFAVLVVVMGAAAYLPARRATAVNPLASLRGN